jgi:hypothetical protein
MEAPGAAMAYTDDGTRSRAPSVAMSSEATASPAVPTVVCRTAKRALHEEACAHFGTNTYVPKFREETILDRLAMLLSLALMPREEVGAKPKLYTAKQVQVYFVLLRDKVVEKLTTRVGFESDEMAAMVLIAEHLRKANRRVPIASVRMVACACALLGSKFCNDNHLDVDAFAYRLGLSKKNLLKFEEMLFRVLLTFDGCCMSTDAIEKCIRYIEAVDLNYSDVMPPHATEHIISPSTVRKRS